MNTSLSTPVSITTTQLFSNRAMDYLMKSGTLSHETMDLLKCLKANMTRGGHPEKRSQSMTYKMSSKSAAAALGYGRIYGTKSSLERLPREIRATLCAEFYHDLDMVNAQPTLLAQYAKREWDTDLSSLLDYVNHRDERLATLGDERDVAKETVIAVLFGAAVPASSPTWLKCLGAELKAFTAKVVASGKHDDLWKASQSAKSAYGAFMSHLLQTEERHCMLAMRDHLTAAGWSVDVLAYDGVMIRHREGVDVVEDMLVDLSYAIREKTGYMIKILEKPMTGFDVPSAATDTKMVAEGVSFAQYQEMKQEFEANHFFFAQGGRVCEYNPQTGKLLQMGKEHAMDYLNAVWSFQTGATEVNRTPFLPMWLKDPKRRTVAEIDLKPSEDPTVFSTFNGFPFQRCESPSDAESRVALFNQLLDALAPEAEMRAILVEWMAHLIQKPFENSMTCVVLAGGKGCGKDTLGDLLFKILGDKYTHNYTETAQFWDKHDEGRMGKLLCKLEEAVGSTNRQFESEFKARITSATTTANPKGVSPITMANYCRYMLTTNDYNPVKLDAQERRFVVNQCGNSRIGDMDFWRAIRDQLFCPEGYRAIGDWLQVQPIGAFPRVLPKSEMALEMIETETPVEQLFLESPAWDGQRTTIADLFRIYKAWCVEHNHPCALNTITFSRRLSMQKAEGRIMTSRTAEARFFSRPGVVPG